jgi:release factor glutamine methyltransferase
VLVPRTETELVVERALVHLPADAQQRVLDLATGSGAIALAIARERQRCHVLGSDLSAAATALAAANARRLKLDNVRFVTGDWYDAAGDELFDLIASNPPYVADDDRELAWQVRRYEPARALFAGPTGLEALSTVIAGAPARLAVSGWLVLEHGARQGEVVRALLGAAGFSQVATFRDLAGHERVSEGVRYHAAPRSQVQPS